MSRRRHPNRLRSTSRRRPSRRSSRRVASARTSRIPCRRSAGVRCRRTAIRSGPAAVRCRRIGIRARSARHPDSGPWPPGSPVRPDLGSVPTLALRVLRICPLVPRDRRAHVHPGHRSTGHLARQVRRGHGRRRARRGPPPGSCPPGPPPSPGPPGSARPAGPPGSAGAAGATGVAGSAGAARVHPGRRSTGVTNDRRWPVDDGRSVGDVVRG